MSAPANVTGLPALQTISVGGEAYSQDLVTRFAPGRRMLNVFGPTETTIISSFASLRPGQHITIGKPIHGMSAMVLDQPFLTSTFGHFHLPLVGEFELASAMAFDTGVFLTVVGAVMLALANLSRMGRWTNPHSINKTAMDVDPSASLPKEHFSIADNNTIRPYLK